MSDVFEPPKAESPRSVARSLAVILCTLLGLIGAGFSCYSGVSIGTQYVLADAMAASPEQAQVMRDIQAAQGWWVMPLTVLQLLVKLGLSLGMAVGGFLVLGHPAVHSRAALGPSVLRPVLLFGVVFELVSALYGAVYVFLRRGTLQTQFTATMATDPNFPQHLAESFGSAFVIAMSVMMVVMLIWAGIKSGLYAFTYRSLGVARD
ncbi:MAG: hypothetical protein KC912_10725 [Proteobacteria bacterium]|nr:hypothetical protein [Pseudomonadota bacterium]